MSTEDSIDHIDNLLARYQASKHGLVEADMETIVINSPPTYEEPFELRLGRGIAQAGRNLDKAAAKLGWRLSLGLCVLTTNAFQFGLSHYGHHEAAAAALPIAYHTTTTGVAEGNA